MADNIALKWGHTKKLNNCPNTKMDGDRDGIPCEKQFNKW